MNRHKNKILFIVVTMLLAVIFTAIVTYLLHLPSDRVIAQWEQPSSIDYRSRAPFRLIILERGTDWSGFPYWERTYNMYVGNEYPYGYHYRFPFYYRKQEIESEIKKSAVEWSHEGVTFRATSGETLFVPRKLLVGEE